MHTLVSLPHSFLFLSPTIEAIFRFTDSQAATCSLMHAAVITIRSRGILPIASGRALQIEYHVVWAFLPYFVPNIRVLSNLLSVKGAFDRPAGLWFEQCFSEPGAQKNISGVCWHPGS
jgi:hypothetical protein